MPTFVYLPQKDQWFNLQLIERITRTVGLDVYFTGTDSSVSVSPDDAKVLLKALSKLTPKELT